VAGPELTDAQVDLLFRTASQPPELTATIREWIDERAIQEHLDALVASSPVGRRFVSFLWEAAKDSTPASRELSASLALAMPERYRIDYSSDTEGRPVCIACDGERLWRVYSDRIGVRSAEPPSAGLADTIDPRWLLNEDQLTVTGEGTVSGRSALTVTLLPDLRFHIRSPFSGRPIPADKIDLAIDADLSVLLRQVWYCGDQPVMRAELTDITLGSDSSVFRIDPPPGTRIVTGGLLAETGMSPAGIAASVAKGVSKLAVDLGWAAIKSAARAATSGGDD
jgi:outer membrane lipoprotein-sorting protein